MLKLSAREQEILDLYLRAGRLEPVAEALGLSIHTVRRQKESVMRKLCVTNSVQLTISAIQRGLVKNPKGSE